MVKVLYVSKALIVGTYRDKLRELEKHVDVTAIMPNKWGKQEVEPVHPGYQYLRRSNVLFHGHNHFHLYRNADRIMDEVRPDLVHIDEEPYSAVTFQLARLSRRRGVPSLFFAWRNLEKSIPPPFGAMRSYVFRSVAGAIAGTQSAARVLRRAGYEKSLAVIPQFGVDPERFAPDESARYRTRADLGLEVNDFLVGFGGRLVREKGVQMLLEAVRRVPRARLLILGDGPEKGRLRRRAVMTNIADRVNFVGRVPSIEVPSWLAALDVLVLPSLTKRGWIEQFGRILVEAMACGVPVLGSDSGEIPGVIGEAGRIVPAGDVQALTDALTDLCEAKELRERLGESARARALATFTQRDVVLRTVEFYRAILGNERRH